MEEASEKREQMDGLMEFQLSQIELKAFSKHIHFVYQNSRNKITPVALREKKLQLRELEGRTQGGGADKHTEDHHFITENCFQSVGKSKNFSKRRHLRNESNKSKRRRSKCEQGLWKLYCFASATKLKFHKEIVSKLLPVSSIYRAC
ncbi:hypothetical protein ACFE04_000845 [Oxalis oulophora]